MMRSFISSPWRAFAWLCKFLFKAVPIWSATGLRFLGSNERGWKCCDTAVGMTVIFSDGNRGDSSKTAFLVASETVIR